MCVALKFNEEGWWIVSLIMWAIECEGWRRHSSLIFLILLFTKPNIEVAGYIRPKHTSLTFLSTFFKCVTSILHTLWCEHFHWSIGCAAALIGWLIYEPSWLIFYDVRITIIVLRILPLDWFHSPRPRNVKPPMAAFTSTLVTLKWMGICLSGNVTYFCKFDVETIAADCNQFWI